MITEILEDTERALGLRLADGHRDFTIHGRLSSSMTKAQVSVELQVQARIRYDITIAHQIRPSEARHRRAIGVRRERDQAAEPRPDRRQEPCLRGGRLSAHTAVMSASSHDQLTLDPDAPGLDDETRRRRRALAKLQQLSVDEFFQLLVRAGIYTEDGQLTPPYRDDGEPSACRPTD
jgi:hypothetical protein